MTGMDSEPKFSTWSAPGHLLRIEYSATVLDEIRMIAVEGYHRVPHGGVETGGILFGAQEKNTVRIQAWRPIACEYAKGPSFLLSEKDEANLADALQSYGGEAELARMKPVGWYRAHTRSEILLSDADVAFYNRFFPRVWQVGLIVRPASLVPTRAGFFFREQDGTIRSQSSYGDIILGPVPAGSRQSVEESGATVEGALAGATGKPRGTTAAPDPPSVRRAETAPMLEAQRASGNTGGRWKWYAASLTVLVLGVLGYWLMKPSPQGLELSATDVGGQLRISWDGAAEAVSHAQRGSIEFEDHGVKTHVDLTPADLRSGSIFYERLSGDVVVRLRMDAAGRQPEAAMTRFLKPGERLPALRGETAENMGPQHQPETKQPGIQTAPPAALAPPPQAIAAAAPVRTIIPFRAPERVVRQTVNEAPGIAPPKIDYMASSGLAGLPPMLGSTPRPPAAPPAPAAVVLPPRPATAAPLASGRIIWTGRLAKNGRLVVERNRASLGTISGGLPAGPARVSAYPGSLTAGGITLFTAEPRYYYQPQTEKAGAENGWNPTKFTWDPDRAAGIRVVEQPGPQNGYKLVLESEVGKLSVVVLEWHATQ